MKRKRSFFIWAVRVLIWLGPGFALSQYAISHGVFGNGGGVSRGGGFGVQGTLGQPLVGTMTGPTSQSVVGFWALYGRLVTSVETLFETLPTEFRLEQNFPNPFNPETVIQFALPEASEVSLKVYNVLGKEIATVVEGRYSGGIHKVVWRPEREASGVYFYRLVAKSEKSGRMFTSVKKLTYVR